jgi:hypothetical protein
VREARRQGSWARRQKVEEEALESPVREARRQGSWARRQEVEAAELGVTVLGSGR